MSKFVIIIIRYTTYAPSSVEKLHWLKYDELLSYKTLLIFYWLTTLGALTMRPKNDFTFISDFILH